MTDSQNNSEYPSKGVRVQKAVLYFSKRIKEMRERNGWNIPVVKPPSRVNAWNPSEIDNKSRGAGER